MNDEQAKHNPPAFPLAATGGGLADHFQGGMSLRDYFAGQAMLGILSNMNGAIVPRDIANAAVAIADETLSVLAERAKAGGGK